MGKEGEMEHAVKDIIIPSDSVFENKRVSMSAMADVFAKLYSTKEKKSQIKKTDNYTYMFFGFPKFELYKDKWSYIIKIMKPLTYKELQKLKQPFPYKEVADKLNNYPNLTSEIMDSIIGNAEMENYAMVGIKKLYKMCNESVQKLMKEKYEL